MPQLKQPMTLKDKSLPEYVNLYCGTCERWISKLRQAQATGRLAYWNMTWSVLAECRQIERSLSEFPYSIIEMMSPQLTRKFAKMIGAYDYETRYFDSRLDNEERHKSVCTAMFRSVLTPYVYTDDDEILSHTFTQDLVFETLDRVPGLRTLDLTCSIRGDNRAHLARMICRLSHLQAFTYPCDCTDEVVEQLGSNCSRLKELDLYLSRGVTNASVQHLLKLRELEFLNLDGTQIDSKQYGLLLSELPIIKNIWFRKMEENILDQVAEENLHKVSQVSGHFLNIHMLAQRCPNITTLDIDVPVYRPSLELSDLAALTTLRTVRILGKYYISSQRYITYNLHAILTGIGPRLTDLTLDSFDRVKLQDIVTLCPALASLSLLECTLLPLDPNNRSTPIYPISEI
jgi:hypothetical protein